MCSVQGREKGWEKPSRPMTKALARQRKDFYNFAFHRGETSGSLGFMQETSGSKRLARSHTVHAPQTMPACPGPAVKMPPDPPWPSGTNSCGPRAFSSAKGPQPPLSQLLPLTVLSRIRVNIPSSCSIGPGKAHVTDRVGVGPPRRWRERGGDCT